MYLIKKAVYNECILVAIDVTGNGVIVQGVSLILLSPPIVWYEGKCELDISMWVVCENLFLSRTMFIMGHSFLLLKIKLSEGK